MGRQVTVFQSIMHQPRPMTCALHHSATESWIFKTSRDDKNSNESSCSSWTITLLFNVINCIRYEWATFDKSTNSILLVFVWNFRTSTRCEMKIHHYLWISCWRKQWQWMWRFFFALPTNLIENSIFVHFDRMVT